MAVGTNEGEGKRLLYLNSHIGWRSEHVYGEGRGGPGPFETARVPNPWLS